MNNVDGIKQGGTAFSKPAFPSSQKPGNSNPAPQPIPAGKSDGSSISGEAKKKEPTGERKDLLDGLKSNYGGNDRIQTAQSKLDSLSDDQLKSVKKRREFDKALTKHEEDHHSVAADLARSSPLYETETGEDGETYRKSGKVMIDTGTEADDDRTVKKMKQVRAAALAPDGNQLAPLSDQDRKVAREATEKEEKAQRRLDAKSSGREVSEVDKSSDKNSNDSNF